MVRKILLIDDDRLQFRLTQQHFKAFQSGAYELEWSATYEDGLAKLLGGDYAACLLDYRLGERDGLALIREAKAHQLTSIIQTSANVGMITTDQALRNAYNQGQITHEMALSRAHNVEELKRMMIGVDDGGNPTGRPGGGNARR